MAKALTKDQLILVGITAATAFINADNSAFNSKREILLAMAKTHAGDVEKSQAVLEGYAQGFIEKGYSADQAKSRKTEAKAVFDAIAKSEVSGDNYEALKSVSGTYHDFIAKARELRGKKERTSTSRTVNKVKLTNHQLDVVEQATDKADGQQLGIIAGTAISNLAKRTAPAFAGYQSFLLIQQTCGQLIKLEGVEEVFKDAAERIMDIAAQVIEAAKTASEAATQATTNATQPAAQESEEEQLAA